VARKASKDAFTVILTHENTDFDALASLLAAAKLFPDAVPVLPLRMNRNLRAFLTIYGGELPFVRREDLPRRTVDKAILVDTQSVVPVRGMSKKTPLQIIDHHPLDQDLRLGSSYHGEPLGATTTLLLEGIREKHIPLRIVEASLLLLGLYEDTGSLTYNTTTPRDIYAAAWLLEQVPPSERSRVLSLMDKYLRQPLSEEQMAIYAALVENGEIYQFHGYAVFIAAIHLSGYVEELSTPVHKVNDLLDPDASFMIFAIDNGAQLIARSNTDAIDVGEIARQFGGGGHSKAAAARVNQTDVAAVKAQLLELLESHVRPPIVVRDIMSFGVHTLQPDMTVKEADAIMRRYGHEGFPVLDHGKLVGVLTRREMERALDHQLGNTPISMYMHKGDIHVRPDDSVNQVQEMMLEHDLGQIPVVENGQVLGIVTRTDLIKLWNAPAPTYRDQDLIARMEAILPAPRLSLILKARDIANSLGYSLYVVGGFVRDLLLGIPNTDLDLVVEGDAIRVARHLARQVEGRVRSHDRFGTAKVILEGTHGTSMPESLDLATARTEFYEQPSALPTVESSSIKQDLHRRDFTINTMAIRLDRDRYGELLDFYGGEKDLRQGLIRVLHNLSFIDDPTRMLRAARLEQRLGFRIESRTLELIDDALGMLDRVSGERLRGELHLAFREAEPEKIWHRLAELNVLPHIHPALHDSDWLAAKFAALRASWPEWRPPLPRDEQAAVYPAEHGPGEAEEERAPEELPPVVLCWGLVTFHMTPAELEGLLVRLKMRQRLAKPLREIKELVAHQDELRDPALTPARLYRLLRPYSPEALFVLYVASDDPVVREHLTHYHQRLRWVRPRLSGEYLRGLGLKPGPIYKEILTQLQDAVLEGRVRTRQEEEEFIQQLIKKAA